MLSAFIHSRLSYPAVHLAVELADQRSVHLGPLVLETNPLKNRTPAVDRRPTCLTLLTHITVRNGLYLYPELVEGLNLLSVWVFGV
jgi:hypothetical protein